MELLQGIKERRSINFFDPAREISSDKINELLELANLSPSSMNLQPWEVMVVRDPKRKEALKKCAFNQPKVTDASAVLIISADPDAIEENADTVLNNWVELGYLKSGDVENYKKMAGGLYGEKNSEARKFFALKNTAFFAMSVMIAARGLGLETHPMDGFDQAAVKKEFGIPDNRIIPCLIAVGYLKPGVKLLPRAYRRPLNKFVKIV